MTKLPKNILVLSFKTKRKAILNILTEFFEGLPYLLYTADNDKDYYILPYSKVITKILDNIDEKLDYPDYFQYEDATYDIWNPRIWDTYILSDYWGYDTLSDEVTFWKPSDVENLKVFTED